MKKCPKCGAAVGHQAGVCPNCGSKVGIVIALPTGQASTAATSVSSVKSRTDDETGITSIEVRDPGTQSEASITSSGNISLVVRGTAGVGKEGEGRVAKTLRSKLESSGLSVSLIPGVDERGEDKLLRTSDRTFTLQVVTAPGAQEFWRDANLGSAAKNVDLQHAVGWLRTAIESKARSMAVVQRRDTLLAVDARHAFVLATPSVLNAYTEEFGSPSSELGFASVWVVGPTSDNCERIGEGLP